MAIAKPNEARDLAIKARAYRFVAIIFVLIGLMLFAYMYSTKIQGNFQVLLHNPFLVSIFILPFLPAVFLSLLASHNEKKFEEVMKKKKL
jgi:hypothetical protein